MVVVYAPCLEEIMALKSFRTFYLATLRLVAMILLLIPALSATALVIS